MKKQSDVRGNGQKWDGISSGTRILDCIDLKEFLSVMLQLGYARRIPDPPMSAGVAR